MDFFSMDGIMPPTGIFGVFGAPGTMEIYSEPMSVGLSTTATESCRMRDAYLVRMAN